MPGWARRILYGSAVGVIVGAWLGSVVALSAWHLAAPELPDKAWGKAFAGELFPGSPNVEITQVSEIAQYEDLESQQEQFGLSFFGGDDYYPGQLNIVAPVESPRDVLANSDPVLKKWGWDISSREGNEEVDAYSPEWFLSLHQVYRENIVEVTVYRRTPAVVVWASTAAWLLGAALGFVLGVRGDVATRSCSPFRMLGWRLPVASIFFWGVALSAPAALIATSSIAVQIFQRMPSFPVIPWDVYMYWGLRPLSLVGAALLLATFTMLLARHYGRASILNT